jgi:hypothetical protein
MASNNPQFPIFNQQLNLQFAIHIRSRVWQSGIAEPLLSLEALAAATAM